MLPVLSVNISIFFMASSTAMLISFICWVTLVVSLAWFVAPMAISSTATLTLAIDSLILPMLFLISELKSVRVSLEPLRLFTIFTNLPIRVCMAVAIVPTSSVLDMILSPTTTLSLPSATRFRFATDTFRFRAILFTTT